MNTRKKKKSGPNQTAKGVRESSTGWMLAILSVDLEQEIDQRLEPLGLNSSHFRILMTLLEGDGRTQADIGRVTFLPGYAVSRNLDFLEGAGLVERRTDDTSRRSHSICLTSKGRSVAPSLFGVVKSLNDGLLSVLKESEKDRLNSLLVKLISGREIVTPEL